MQLPKRGIALAATLAATGALAVGGVAVAQDDGGSRGDRPGVDQRGGPSAEEKRRYAQALAAELDVPVERVEAALQKVGPPRGGHHGPNPERLATALEQRLNTEVGAADVSAAFEVLHDARESGEERPPFEEMRRRLAAELAERIDAPAGDIERALEQVKPDGPRPQR